MLNFYLVYFLASSGPTMLEKKRKIKETRHTGTWYQKNVCGPRGHTWFQPQTWFQPLLLPRSLILTWHLQVNEAESESPGATDRQTDFHTCIHSYIDTISGITLCLFLLRAQMSYHHKQRLTITQKHPVANPRGLTQNWTGRKDLY